MNNTEIINEIKIVSNSQYHMYLGIYPSTTHIKGFLLDPYFKVYNSESERTADKVARISILRPEYVYHNGRDGKKHFNLSKNRNRVYD